MTSEQATADLRRRLQAVFDAVYEGEFSLITREAMFVETVAHLGIEKYVARCNQEKDNGTQAT